MRQIAMRMILCLTLSSTFIVSQAQFSAPCHADEPTSLSLVEAEERGRVTSAFAAFQDAAKSSQTKLVSFFKQPVASPLSGFFVPEVSMPQFSFPQFSSPAEVQRYTDIRAEIGVLGLVREQPTDQVIALNESFAPIFNASELQGSMQFGLRAELDVLEISPLFGGTDLQLGYFGINSLDAETTLASVAVSPIFFNSIPVTPEATANIIYSSNLYSGEINAAFRSRRRFRPIAGVRYFKLEDYYDAFNHDSGGGATRIGGFSTTNNSLIGGQFGAEADLFQTKFLSFYASGKYGAMHNRVEGAANAADSSGNEVTKNYGDSNYCSLIDAEAGVDIRFAGPLSFRVGYQFLYASDVALGIDQNASVQLLSPGETVTFASQQWHGLNFTTVWEF